jgi:hypothetical protein
MLHFVAVPSYVHMLLEHNYCKCTSLPTPSHHVHFGVMVISACNAGRSSCTITSIPILIYLCHTSVLTPSHPLQPMWAEIPTCLSSHVFSPWFDSILKGTVQWELRGVKIGINRSITCMMYSLAGKCPLPCPKGQKHKRSQRL